MPSALSASIAWFTQPTSGLPLAKTSPKYSWSPIAGNCPTTTPFFTWPIRHVHVRGRRVGEVAVDLAVAERRTTSTDRSNTAGCSSGWMLFDDVAVARGADLRAELVALQVRERVAPVIGVPLSATSAGETS